MKKSRKNKDIKRGEIYVIKNPKKNGGKLSFIIKRCVGIPGDSIKDILTHETHKDYYTKSTGIINSYVIKDSVSASNFDLSLSKLGQLQMVRNRALFIVNLDISQFSQVSKIVNQLGYRIEPNYKISTEENNIAITKQYFDLLKDDLTIADEKLSNNEYWFIGDNRPSSLDSRSFGFVNSNSVLRKGLLILYGKRDGRQVFLQRIN